MRDAARIRAWLDSGAAPAPARDAATVALVRDGDGGLEVHLLRRVRQLAFAAGMYVFPGGAVDPADVATQGDGAAGGAGVAGVRAAFGAGLPAPGTLLRAAVRETFEETGVLLAGRPGGGVVDDVTGPGWEAERVALETGARSLADVLARHGLELRPELLVPLAHWVTPDPEPRRFDTRFFLAALPSGQQTRDVGGEADERRWVRPREALDGLAIMPPTRAVLTDLARFDDVASALAAEREITRVQPRFVPDGEGVRLAV